MSDRRPDHPPRRRWLARLLAAGVLPPQLAAAAAASAAVADAAPDADDRIRPDRVLRFPRDHGAHPASRIEWWYATGWLQAAGAEGAPGSARPGAAPGTAAPGAGALPAGGTWAGVAGSGAGAGAGPEPLFGFQLTFFRSRGPAFASPDDRVGGRGADRFLPRQLLFAHAALTDLRAGRHRHAQRIARWSGDEALPEAHAARADTRVQLGPWWLRREPLAGGASRYRARLAAPEAGFTLALQLDSTQPPLLQGQAGHSRKGPRPGHASHYYSQPQLAVQAQLRLGAQDLALPGRAWLDHEWSDALLDPEAVGWDWAGINLADGGALTVFQLRRRDGSVLWAGGSHRAPGGVPRAFAPEALRFEPLRSWTSPATGARYPVAWRIHTPLGSGRLQALLDAQELDSRSSTGAVYWEGLADWREDRDGGARLGLGYLEITGRQAPLRLG